MTKILRLIPCLALLLTIAACAPQPKLAGNLAMTLKDYEQAVVKYKEALKDDPNSVVLLTGLGRAYYNLAKYGEAVTAFKSATEIEDYPQATFYLGLSTIMNGDRPEGFDILKNFRYPANIDITNSVRDMARRLEGNDSLEDAYISRMMFQAWNDGLNKK